jgi:hypothetical protein
MQKWRLRLKHGEQEQPDLWTVQVRGWVDSLENKIKDNAPVESFM